MIRLVAFDLDGTVLSENNQVSEASLDTIRALVDRGIVVASISGRNIENSKKPFEDELDLLKVSYLGSYNGAIILSREMDGQRELLHEERLPEEVYRGIVDYINGRKLSFVYCGCEIGRANIQEAYIADRDSDSLRALQEQVGFKEELISSDVKPYGEEVRFELVYDEKLVSRIKQGELGVPPKLILLPGRERLDQVLAEMQAIFGGRIYLSRTGDDRVEVMNPAVNKGVALHAIAEVCGVSIDEALAVGDGDNDLPMLREAGVGVLLGSADEETRGAAREAGIQLGAPFAAEGFAKAVRHYVLDKKTP